MVRIRSKRGRSLSTDQLTEREVAAFIALMESSSLLQQRMDRHLRDEAGISQPQFEILFRVANVGAGIRMSDLADQVVLSRSGVSYRVDQLVKLGLLKRTGDPSDERGIIASATAKGRALIERVAPLHHRLIRESFFDILDSAALDTLTKILAAVSNHLRNKAKPED